MKKGIDYIGVGSGAMIFNDRGKVFITQRGPKTRNEAGKWDSPGGAVEFGERCEDAVVREVKEEFDIDIRVTEFLEVVSHIIKEENQHWVSPSYIAKHVSGIPKILEPEKCINMKWVDLSEVEPDLLSLASQSNFSKYKEKYGLEPPKPGF